MCREISTAHIEEAYRVAGNGSMIACLGKDCPDPCRRERIAISKGGGVVTGKVRLYNEAEAAYQHGVLTPALSELGLMWQFIWIGINLRIGLSHIFY